MRYSIKLSLILASALSGQAVAATFSVPEYFEFMYADREKPVFVDSKQQIDIAAGQHELVVRYRQDIEQFKEENTFKSEPIIIDINVADADNIVLSAVEPKKNRQAEAYEEAPKFTLVNNSGYAVDYQSYLLPLKPGFQLGRDYLQEVKDFKAQQNSENKIASLQNQLAKVSKNTDVKQMSTTALDKVKKLYNQVDPSTQRAYRVWIIDPSIVAKQQSVQLNNLKQSYLNLNSAEKREIQIWMID